jgi:hypothetical protein
MLLTDYWNVYTRLHACQDHVWNAEDDVTDLKEMDGECELCGTEIQGFLHTTNLGMAEVRSIDVLQKTV